MATTTFPSRSEASNTATAGKDYLIYLNAGESDTNPTWLLLGPAERDLTRQADEIDASKENVQRMEIHHPRSAELVPDLESVYLAGDKGAKFLEASFSWPGSRSTSNSNIRIKAM